MSPRRPEKPNKKVLIVPDGPYRVALVPLPVALVVYMTFGFLERLPPQSASDRREPAKLLQPCWQVIINVRPKHSYWGLNSYQCHFEVSQNIVVI